jgi:hypothetical protein
MMQINLRLSAVAVLSFGLMCSSVSATPNGSVGYGQTEIIYLARLVSCKCIQSGQCWKVCCRGGKGGRCVNRCYRSKQACMRGG